MRGTPAGLVAAALEAATDLAVDDVRPVGGGCIADAYRMELGDGRSLFVKTHPSPPPAFFSVEAEGLGWLAEAGAVRIPRPVAWQDEDPAFLALEWVEPGPRSRASDERLGRELATLHRSGAACFGWHRDGYIGSLAQVNTPTDSWADFYWSQRIEPLARRAAEAGSVDPTTRAELAALEDRMATLVGPPEPPARLHGDLWGGNLIVTAGSEPVLVDPAPYGGHREVDLAMMRLFGGFGEVTFRAYTEEHPLADGAEARVALYQLYPLLVHAVLFGAGYGSQVRRALDRCR